MRMTLNADGKMRMTKCGRKIADDKMRMKTSWVNFPSLGLYHPHIVTRNFQSSRFLPHFSVRLLPSAFCHLYFVIRIFPSATRFAFYREPNTNEHARTDVYKLP